MRIFLVSLLLAGAFGCRTPKSPDKDWTGVARILPIIVTNSAGETRWTRDQLISGFKDNNAYWADVGVQFKMMEPETVVSDVLYEQTGWFDFLSIYSASRIIAKDRNVYPVYFVDSITRGDKIYGGMSTYADAPLGFQYGTIVSAVARGNSGRIIAHELGHAWNLRHSWDDKLADTPGVDSTDCNIPIRCNVMSYCHGPLTCLPPPFFSPEQIIESRTWSLSQSRFHLLETDIQVQQIVLPLQAEFDPILDPVFEKE